MFLCNTFNKKHSFQTVVCSWFILASTYHLVIYSHSITFLEMCLLYVSLIWLYMLIKWAKTIQSVLFVTEWVTMLVGYLINFMLVLCPTQWSSHHTKFVTLEEGVSERSNPSQFSRSLYTHNFYSPKPKYYWPISRTY